MQCSIYKERRKLRERGNPAWWLTWQSPRIRINWWKHQRWIMSTMQRGIILSKHGSPANTQAYTHMVWGLDKSTETLFSGYHCDSFWAERTEHRFKLVDHKVHFKTASILRYWIRAICFCIKLQHVFCLIVYIFSLWKIISQPFSLKHYANVKSPRGCCL